MDQALVSAQLHVLPAWQMDWLIVLHMSKLKSQASEWHAWSPLLVNDRTGRGLCQFFALSPRPSCHDPLLSSMWTHSKPWNPSHQRVSPLSFTVKVKYDSWAVLQIVTTSQKCLASHWKSSLLKPDQLHFLVFFSPHNIDTFLKKKISFGHKACGILIPPTRDWTCNAPHLAKAAS